MEPVKVRAKSIIITNKRALELKFFFCIKINLLLFLVKKRGRGRGLFALFPRV
jgi:hypothetical protein